MKISKLEAKKLSNIFFNHKDKNNINLSLHDRGLQQYWYNKRSFPYTPYCDTQYIGFDPNPNTYQDCLIIQERKIKKFFNTIGWILKL